MRLSRILLSRLVLGLVVLWGTATFVFLAIHLTAGDPAIAILGGPDALPTPAVIAQVRKEYGLDQPLIVQYLHYIGRLAHGDLGESYRLRIPVVSAIGEQLGATLALAFWSALSAIALAILSAVLTARRSPWIGAVASGSELVLTSVPVFVIGLLTLLAFSFQLHLFPVAGNDGWRAMVLPVVTLSLPLAAMMSQLLRNDLDSILEQPFILTARARGLSDLGVRLGHALRHALVTLITFSGYMFGFLLGGTVITETLFARQGIGRLMADSALASDVPVVTGIALLSASFYVVVNLAVDLINAAVDPRARAA